MPGKDDVVTIARDMMGGTLNLHGTEKNSWTKLAKTAEAGSTSIEVLDAADWKAGEEIVLASTDFDPRQAERRTIAAISGNTITLDKKLIADGAVYKTPEAFRESFAPSPRSLELPQILAPVKATLRAPAAALTGAAVCKPESTSEAKEENENSRIESTLARHRYSI